MAARAVHCGGDGRAPFRAVILDGDGATVTSPHICQRWYHTYVEKTTVYFPAELKRAVSRYASRRGISEAEVIRQAVADAMADDEIPRPRSALFSSDVLMADDVDVHLDGFGLQ